MVRGFAIGLWLCCLVGCTASALPWGTSGSQVSSFYKGQPMRVVRSATSSGTNDGVTVYVVQAGDTLYGIARRFGTTVAALDAANRIGDPRTLQIGHRISIPHTSNRDKGTRARPSSTKPSAGKLASPPKQASSAKQRAGPTSKKRKYLMEWPVTGQITSRFGQRWGRAHDGIDIAAQQGTTVRAAMDGIVLFAGVHGSYGHLVILRHSGSLVTVYAHNQMNLVRKGQSVRRGQSIAKVGMTGRATGPHLHFEVRRGTRPVNPLDFLAP